LTWIPRHRVQIARVLGWNNIIGEPMHKKPWNMNPPRRIHHILDAQHVVGEPP
jgi:hypothetical protein